MLYFTVLLKRKLLQVNHLIRRIIAKILPQTIKQLIRRWLDNFRAARISVFSRHRFLTRLNYSILSGQFSREQVAVIKGMADYRTQQGVVADSCILLRRNIHRIEKGLIMRPAKPVFALDYIEKTVEVYVSLINQPTDKTELRWFSDVLETYFNTVEQTPLITSLAAKFRQVKPDFSDSSEHFSPYARRALPLSQVDYSDFLALCRQRRSTRWFLDKKVPRALIEQAVTAAAWAPSACNRQPFNFYSIDKQPLLKQIMSLPMGTTGFAGNIQCGIVIVGDLACYESERDRHLIYIDGSLAAMQLMLALETLGLSSCPINWPDVEHLEKRMADKLSLSATQRPVMLIGIGYADPDGGIPYSQKKSHQQLIRWIEDEH